MFRQRYDYFDFSQAMSDGRDLRIYDRNGSQLSYQRAYWDASSQKALLRVRLPEALLDDSLVMRWGCPGAQDRSTATVWDGIPDSVGLEVYSVLVGDFEAKSALSTLPAPISQTYWHIMAFDSTVTYQPTDWVEGIPAKRTRIRIAPEQFAPPDGIGGDIGWETVKDSITNLTFFVSGGTETWIDDVRIFGINRDDLK